MMKGYIKNNQADKVVDLFKRIKNPDEIIIILLFNACAQLGTEEALNSIKQVSSKIVQSFQSNSRLLTSLLDGLVKCGDITYAENLFNTFKNKTVSMYKVMINGFLKENNCLKGKSGCVNRAKEIFEKMPQPNQIGYAAMINSYGLNGMGLQSIELYYQMPKELINEATYICVLNACSHSGLVNEALSIFKTIEIETQRIYTTIIDCLSRALFFEEAQKLMEEFERLHIPALPMYPSATVLLANVDGSSGHIDKASDIKTQLYQSDTKKRIGLAWTVTNRQVYQFRAHDRSHPRSHEIKAELEKIANELIDHGHVFDAILCGHSEKIAIAWNFVVNPHTSKIQVTKNLRVCGDCHRATKLIAAIRQCEIIVSDANRIHHFYTNGQCSCNDYF
ncbi:unnamed protein product [Rotaria magnacalcarata]|uniref:DYW domain-containing protein n=1 Tax=Rotaria magnacalcarata TaxID=392030 RepID=A0A820CAP9_9BILA|nr:unnamed protein product [Rotaria magnacalcarata]